MKRQVARGWSVSERADGRLIINSRGNATSSPVSSKSSRLNAPNIPVLLYQNTRIDGVFGALPLFAPSSAPRRTDSLIPLFSSDRIDEYTFHPAGWGLAEAEGWNVDGVAR